MKRCSRTHGGDHLKTRRDSHAIQNTLLYEILYVTKTISLTFEITNETFNKRYPKTLRTLGDFIRKTRIDRGLEIKDLQSILGVDENTIIGWELHDRQPTGPYLKRIVDFICTDPEPVDRKTLWSLCFAQNPSYPKQIKTLGDKIRATRMKNFMSIDKLARVFNVDKTTLAKWEKGKSCPSPTHMESIQAFLLKNDPDGNINSN